MVTQSYRVSPDVNHVDQALPINHRFINYPTDTLGMQCDHRPPHRTDDSTCHTQLLSLGNRFLRFITVGMDYFSSWQRHLAA